jgi:hypothetical protein
VERLKTRPKGVDLLASLVQGLRYCGLLDESLAAHAEAREIDPSARTSVAYTHFVRGDYEGTASSSTESDLFVHVLAELAMGQTSKARDLIRGLLGNVNPLLLAYFKPLQLLIEGDVESSISSGRPLYQDFPDPEGRFFFARNLAWAGLADEALELIEGTATAYCALPPPGRDPWLGSIDGTTRYAGLLSQVERRREAHRQSYRLAREGPVSGA